MRAYPNRYVQRTHGQIIAIALMYARVLQITHNPPYNLELAGWDIYDNYIEWAAKWLDEAYRVLSKNGSMVIFGGIQFRDVKSGDLIDMI